MRFLKFGLGNFAMHRVGSAGNTSNSGRSRKEKRLTYLLNDADDTKVRGLFYFVYTVSSMCRYVSSLIFSLDIYLLHSHNMLSY